jgi:tRNA pseudouridine32 synthase/23S rRNA pseudouridine746 synthase
MSGSLQTITAVTEALRTQYWSWVVYETLPSTGSLTPFLVHHLPHIDPSSWDERFAFGGVYVNGIEALGDRELPLPCKVEYYEPKFEISDAASIFPAFHDDYILYQDEHVVAVYKPPGLSSMPAKEQRHFSVKASVERCTGATVHMPSRLDVSTQGLIIMSISEHAHARLQQAFEHRKVFKEYRCASLSQSPWMAHTVELPIGRDVRHSVLRRVDNESGKPARTEFISIGRARSEDLEVNVFRALPTTGRTHQIRVHASASGIPLLGDRFYEGASASYLHLVSYAVALKHPVTGIDLQISLPQRLLPLWITDQVR